MGFFRNVFCRALSPLFFILISCTSVSITGDIENKDSLPPPAAAGSAVIFDIPEIDWFDAENYFSRFPLPQGFYRVDKKSALSGSYPASVRIRVTQNAWRCAAVIGRRYMGVKVPYSYERISISRDEAVLRNLTPLEKIAPPFRALPVDNLLPGENGYRFTENICLTLAAAADICPEQALQLESWIKSLVPAYEKPVIIGAAGDIVIEPPGQKMLERAGWDISVLLGDTLPVLRSRDLLLANLEGPVSGRGTPNPVKRFRFRHAPEVLDALVDAGIDYFSFANNHTHDFGIEAFTDTLEYLEKSAALYSGAGMNIAEALKPARFKAGSAEFALFGFADFPVESRGFKPADAAASETRPGILADHDALLKGIKKEAEAGRIPVVMAHAGYEYIKTPSRAVRNMYCSFVDAGAHLVLGSHPHVLQGIESYKNGIIAYSLGNFLFTHLDEPPIAQKSAIFSFVFYKGVFRGYSLVPVLALDDSTQIDPDFAGAEASFVKLNRLITP